MRKAIYALMIAAWSWSTIATAAEKLPYGFLKSSPQEVAALASSSDLIFSFDMRPHTDWNSQTVAEAELFDGFRSFDSWNATTGVNDTVIYVSEVAFVTDKKITQDSLASLSRAEFLSEIDPGFAHEAVDAASANQAYVTTQEKGRDSARAVIEAQRNRNQIDENQKNQVLNRIESTFQNNVSVKWCMDSATSCLKSTARIPTFYRTLLSGVSAVINVPDSVEVYSELRVLNEKELASRRNASAGVSLTGFLSNKTLVSMSNDILAHDLGNGSTLISIKTYVVLEKDDLDKFARFGSYDFVIGNSMLNGDDGILMGLPLYSQRMAEALRERL